MGIASRHRNRLVPHVRVSSRVAASEHVDPNTEGLTVPPSAGYPNFYWERRQHHRVNRVAEGVEDENVTIDGDRQHPRTGRAQVSEKQQDHHAGEAEANRAFADNILDRGFDEHRLIKHHARLQRLRYVEKPQQQEQRMTQRATYSISVRETRLSSSHRDQANGPPPGPIAAPLAMAQVISARIGDRPNARLPDHRS
jgi:hypothetical protein